VDYRVRLESQSTPEARPTTGTEWLGEELEGMYSSDKPVKAGALIQVKGVSYRVESIPDAEPVPTLIVSAIYP
jgi:hypothetical protein